MKIKSYISFILKTLSIILLISFISCDCVNQKENDSDKEGAKNSEIIVEVESYVSSSSEIKTVSLESGEKIVSSEGEGWISFDINIPVAGRYKTEVNISSQENSICWVEDHIDNKDGRTYNITGDISVNSNDDLQTYWKDGSPLNEGLHKIKLHFNKASKINWIKFTLIKKHETTPLVLEQNTSGKEWKIAWADEFNGNSLDTTKWTFDVGNWGWGNQELQYYTKDREKNLRLEDGTLIIEAHKNDMNEKWTSARITTRGKQTFIYGKIEFRAKVPSNRGNWSAGWTLGDNYVDELSWPYCGEIDILESVGYEMDDENGNGIAHASVHCGAYYFKLGNQPTATIKVENMNNEWHTYALEWDADSIKMFVDGFEYFAYGDTSTELAWPFDKAQNIILNLAMGGGWGGQQGIDPAISSQKMEIDYVRVYERN